MTTSPCSVKMIFRTISPLCFFHSNKKRQHTWVTGGRGTVITPPPTSDLWPTTSPLCLFNCPPAFSSPPPPLSVHFRWRCPTEEPSHSVCVYRCICPQLPLLLKPPIAFLKFLVELNDQALFPPECWRVSSSAIEEEAKLWLVLCGEVEQPLAQYGVVLFQVLDQICLFLHHLLQIRASSVTKIRVCKRSSYKNTSLEGYLKYFSNYAAIKK